LRPLRLCERKRFSLSGLSGSSQIGLHKLLLQRFYIL
jgi:hypothetical protein